MHFEQFPERRIFGSMVHNRTGIGMFAFRTECLSGFGELHGSHILAVASDRVVPGRRDRDAARVRDRYGKPRRGSVVDPR